MSDPAPTQDSGSPAHTFTHPAFPLVFHLTIISTDITLIKADKVSIRQCVTYMRAQPMFSGQESVTHLISFVSWDSWSKFPALSPP